MSSYVVRRAAPGDTDELARLMVEYTVDFYKHSEPDRADVNSLIERLLEDTIGIQFVTEEDDELTGFATVYLSYDSLEAGRIAIMHDLYLVEQARGGGAAEALFEACRKYASENECKYMSWETAPDNHRAQRFYARVGGRRQEWVPYSIEL
jgi:GNAT superfamily N-acetyltransferase